MNLFTETALVAHLKGWCGEHLGRHDSQQYLKYQEIFKRRLADKHDEQQAEHSNNGRFGMSGAASCLRATAAKWARVPGVEFSGDDRATFEIGHVLEVMALAVLEASGFAVSDAQVACDLPPAYSSHADAVVAAGPVPLPYPLALSVKTASYKMSGRTRDGFKRHGFCALPLDGVQCGQSSWYLQLQLELAALKLAYGLVLVVAKDLVKTMENDPIMQQSGSLSFYAEIIPADPRLATEAVAGAGVALDVLRQGRDPHQVPPIVYRERGFLALPAPGDAASGWGGENQKATGDWNPCYACAYADWCKKGGR